MTFLSSWRRVTLIGAQLKKYSRHLLRLASRVEESLLERIRDFEVVINIRSSSKFTRSVFAASPRLKLLSLWGTGTDNVDLDAAAAHGVTVVTLLAFLRCRLRNTR